MASRPSCWRRARLAGVLPAATADFAAWVAASSATAPMAQRYGVQEAARFFAAQKAGVALVRGLAAEEGIDIEPAGEGEHLVAHRANRWHVLENIAATVQRLFGERWPLWRKAEMEERLLRSPEAQGCLVVPHYLGLHPLRYVRGLARGRRAPRRTRPRPYAGYRLATGGGAAPADDAGRNGDRRARARRDQWVHARETRPAARMAASCRRSPASWSPGRSRPPSRRPRVGRSRRWSPTRATCCSTSACCATADCCLAPGVASTRRPRRSPGSVPG